MAQHAQPHEIDIHPAGAADAHAHHGHVVVSQRMLLGVLVALLALTFLTIGAAKTEVWIAHTFGVEIPHWVNVAVALSIAAVKSTLVALFFMQLRYDNPLNAITFVFSIFTVALFLGFTMLDLGSRDAIYDYKARAITSGGTGLDGSGPIVELARRRAQEAGTYDPALDHHGHEEHAGAGSTAERSRPRTGITLPELGGGGAHDGHDAHGAPAGDAHAPAGGQPASAPPAEKSAGH